MTYRSVMLFGVGLAFWTSPARACDTGPWPVQFKHLSSVPTDKGNYTLAGAADTLKMAGSGYGVRLIVYNLGSSVLWKARIAEARVRLTKYGVAENLISVVPVRSQGGMVAGAWVGRQPSMTVELSKGCGG